jgi:hypothetical protein
MCDYQVDAGVRRMAALVDSFPLTRATGAMLEQGPHRIPLARE